MKKTVCAYCGVGCKFEFENEKLKPIKDYPTNSGLACAKGLSQIESIFTNRLKEVKIRKDIKDEFETSNYDEAFKLIASKLKSTDPKRVGFYLSGQMLNEDYYVANKLAKGFVGTSNCDTNSRTCMASAVVGYKKSFGLDYVPLGIEDIEKANLLILTGANPAESHVVLFNKIKKAKKRGLKVVVIDPRFTLSAKIADIYLPIKPNKDIEFFNLLALRLIKDERINKDFINTYANNFESYKEEILKLDEAKLLKDTTLKKDSFEEFYKLFLESKNIITAWTMGINQSSQGVDKNLAINNLHIITGQINKDGSGPFSLTGQPNAMGGREVGGLSTTLAVHLDFSEENCQKVAKFWNSKNIAKQNGLTAFEMIKAANEGKIDILIICHTDPVYHLPNRNFVQKAISKIPFVVEINAYEDSETSKFSHLLLPALPFGQKEGTQVNLDRTLTKVEALYPKNGILQDWEIFAKIGEELGYKEEFSYESSKEVFEEYQKMTKLSFRRHLNIFETNYDKLKDIPHIWGKNLFKNHTFFTKNKKANLFFVENKNLSEQPSSEFPFILLTGRTRDQWHSGSKSAKVKNLLKYKKLEFVEINKNDAFELGLKDGDIVKISSKRGELKAEVVISDINPKTIFIPLSHRDINFLTNDLLDDVSKQPDYNHSAVKIEKISKV